MRRYFVLLASALTLVCPGFAAVDQDLLAMAPTETTLLTGIDVLKTAGSPFGAYMLRQMQSDDASFQELITQVGFDPRQDLESVLIAGVASKAGPNSRYVVLARGTFDSERMAKLARSHGSVSVSLSGIPVQVQGGREHEFAFGFPERGILLMGDLAVVREILSKRTSGSAIDAKLLEQVQRVGPDHDVWFATILSGNFLGAQLGKAVPPQLEQSQALRGILESRGGFRFGSTVGLSLDLITRSAEDARSLVDVLRFAGNYAQMQNNDVHSDLIASLMSGLQLDASGSTVHASLSVPEHKLESAMNASSQHGRGR